RTDPDAIRRSTIDPNLGLRGYQIRYLVGDLPAEAKEGTAAILAKMYQMLVANDATLVEINPLALLRSGVVIEIGRASCREGDWSSDVCSSDLGPIPMPSAGPPSTPTSVCADTRSATWSAVSLRRRRRGRRRSWPRCTRCSWRTMPPWWRSTPWPC